MRVSPRLCTIPECERHVHARDICRTHYERLRTTGTVELVPRPPRTCSIPDCTDRVLARDLCQLHYGRIRRTGTPHPIPTEDFPTRFWANVNRGADCWPWTLRPDASGYGRISRHNRLLYAHRVAYELAVGPIPDGLTIDHLCRVTICVNPAHLEAVTLAENTRRQMAARKSA